jgi:hypothetical protein
MAENIGLGPEDTEYLGGTFALKVNDDVITGLTTDLMVNSFYEVPIEHFHISSIDFSNGNVGVNIFEY